MSASDSSLVQQLKTVIEKDRQAIRRLQEEIDRLRFLLGLHSLKPAETDSASGGLRKCEPTKRFVPT